MDSVQPCFRSEIIGTNYNNEKYGEVTLWVFPNFSNRVTKES